MSETTNSGELGDSDGHNKRMDRPGGENELARANTCAKGLNETGIECTNDGENVVGGSYLTEMYRLGLRRQMRNIPDTHDEHIPPFGWYRLVKNVGEFE